MPVRREGLDAAGIVKTLGAKIARSAVSEETFDGPAYVDYRNPDGFILTTKMNLEAEPLLVTKVGTVPVRILAHCGNNTWREMGSPGKK